MKILYPRHKEIMKTAYCHSENSLINDLTILLFKISTTFNNGIDNLDMYLFIHLIK